MDNLGNGGPQSTNGKEPLSPEAGPNGPQSAQTKPANGPAPVSRAPLNLGGAGAATAAPAAAPTAAPAAAPRAPVPRPAAAPLRPAPAAAGADRITGCKTFFTKLHPGAIDFLDEQINQWLKDNPSVIIKMTNTSVGEVQGKKTEANILMTVWYTGRATKSSTHMG